MIEEAAGDLSQYDVESVTRTWKVFDADGNLQAPDSIMFHAERLDAAGNPVAEITWGVAGSGATHETLVDNGDGTGTWHVAAGQLDVDVWDWWALATLGTTTRIPRARAEHGSHGLHGKFEIRER